MTGTLFFRMVLKKLSGITSNKPILISTIFFTIMNISFFSLRFDLFSSQSNQEQCSLCCSSPCFRVLLLCTHYGSLQCFSTYFRKLKEIGVLRPVFPDYFISKLLSFNCSNQAGTQVCKFSFTLDKLKILFKVSINSRNKTDVIL